MRLSQLMTGIDGNWSDIEIKGITCDSRRVEEGWLFVCIAGNARDGHDYAPAAAEKGAAVILTQRDTGVAGQYILPDTRAVWPVICANWFDHPAKKIKMIGFTGTNGKTTSTFLMKHLLEQIGKKVGLIGTICNMIGDEELPSGHTTPDAYELQELLAKMVAASCEYAVMELSSHALDQGRAAGLYFEAGVFTNLTQDHLDYHLTMENYMAAKKRLFRQCRLGVFNADDPWTPQMMDGLTIPTVTYSLGNDAATYTARNVRCRADGVDFELLTFGTIARVRLGIPGAFSVYNAMGVAACALALGIPFDTVVSALSKAKGVKGRVEIVPTDRPYTIVIDYAHTPDGLENVCKTLKEGCKGRLIVLFGCGGDRDRGKRPQMGAIAAAYGDVTVVTSDNPRSEEPTAIIQDIVAGIPAGTRYHTEPDRAAAIAWALKNAQPDDTVLLAGKGHETYQVLKDETIHMDEREIIAAVLAQG